MSTTNIIIIIFTNYCPAPPFISKSIAFTIYDRLSLSQPAVVAKNEKRRILKRVRKNIGLRSINRGAPVGYASLACVLFFLSPNCNNISVDHRQAIGDHNDDNNNNIIIGLQYRYRKTITGLVIYSLRLTCAYYYHHFF
jgi:hypothetical protein